MNIAELKKVKLLIQTSIRSNKNTFKTQRSRFNYSVQKEKMNFMNANYKILELEVDKTIENIQKWRPNVIDSFLILFAHQDILEFIEESEIITNMIEEICPINNLSLYKAKHFNFFEPK